MPAGYKKGVVAEVHYPPRKRSKKTEKNIWTEDDQKKYREELFRMYMTFKNRDGKIDQKDLRLPLPTFRPDHGKIVIARSY